MRKPSPTTPFPLNTDALQDTRPAPHLLHLMGIQVEQEVLLGAHKVEGGPWTAPDDADALGHGQHRLQLGDVARVQLRRWGQGRGEGTTPFCKAVQSHYVTMHPAPTSGGWSRVCQVHTVPCHGPSHQGGPLHSR